MNIIDMYRIRLRALIGVAVIAGSVMCCNPSNTEPPLFERLDASVTGIDFSNEIIEDEVNNILNYSNIYIGAGVGIGDFNNDGRPDIFLGGSMESSRLYLNTGDFKFEDVTQKAKVTTDRWITGVAVVDINADGWEDIYLSVSGIGEPDDIENLLFVNDGAKKRDALSKGDARSKADVGSKGDAGSNMDVSFTEKGREYGLADASQCSQANFFDYDKDGDLDLIVVVNPTDYTMNTVNNIRSKKVNGESISTDKLYRNNAISNDPKIVEAYQNGTLPRFTDVSKEAGILIEGYSLSLNVSDLNNDNWPDIYITNDFLTNDIIYINNQDGTFTDRAGEMLQHTSFASMGIDVADINNDGQSEIYTLDMLPEDNTREKLITAGKSYDVFQHRLQMGYQSQYSRNTLQLNNGDGTYSEIGQLFNVQKTDWSWSALLADYDNDGYRDLFITNGFRRDLGNLDYIVYGEYNPFGSPEAKKKRQLAIIKEQPGAQLPNYVYQNQAGNGFVKKSKAWGVSELSYSHGAAYADLDSDGDLDLVVNNLGQEAFVYRNRADELTTNHYLQIQLTGPAENATALGAKVWLYYGDKLQFAQQTTYRGYESTVDPVLHFGLGAITAIDSVKVLFSDGTVVLKKDVKTDAVLQIENVSTIGQGENFMAGDTSVEHDRDFKTGEASALRRDGLDLADGAAGQRAAPVSTGTTAIHNTGSVAMNAYAKKSRSDGDYSPTLFVAANVIGLKHLQKEDLQVDFNLQPLLPHQHSQLGPALAKGDINGDGLEDIFIGGAAGRPGAFFNQNEDGSFSEETWSVDLKYEDTNALLFDADGDTDLDLYVTSGGVDASNAADIYQDRLYVNDGAGNFSRNENALPDMPTSTKALAAVDYDNDGDLDLFVGGRVVPGKYPQSPQSYLLENQGGTFKNGTEKILPGIKDIGMVTDALWSDYDNDNDLDLILVGEWMPITLFENEGGKLAQAPKTIPFSSGWWNTLAAGDFDNDGDTDYLAGNLGLNTNYRASREEPICLYVNDYDKNGSIDPVLCQYIDGVEQVVHSRDKLIEQIPPIKKRFDTYKKYAETPFSEVFKRQELKDMQTFKSYNLASAYIENLGDGNFEVKALPTVLQLAPIKKFLVRDINADGHLDVLAVGNDYSTEVFIGRYDAATGAVMLGDGKGGFKIERGAHSGFLANKNAQNMISVNVENTAKELILVGNNGDSLQVFSKR